MGSRGALERGATAHCNRERLLAAMIEESASAGYEGTAVARVAARAGLSRAEFYRRFAGREECFLAAFDELLMRACARVQIASRTLSPAGADPHRGARAGLATLLELAHSRPAAARLCLIQTRSASVSSSARLDGALELFARMLADRGGSGPRSVGAAQLVTRRTVGVSMDVSATVAYGIVGGIYRALYARLLAGRESELPGLGEDLLEWMRCYESPALAPQAQGRRKRSTQARTVTSTHGGGDPAQRLAAYDAGMQRLLDAASAPLQAAPDWPSGVRAALGAILGLLGREPALLRLLSVEILTLGPDGRERDAHSLTAFARLLAPVPAPGGRGQPQPLVWELCAGGIWEVLRRHAVRGLGSELPARADALAHLALAPYIARETGGSADSVARSSACRTSSPRAVRSHA